MPSRFWISLDVTHFVCLNCGASNELDDTLEEFLEQRRGKRAMRPIELDSDGYSRKWAGTFIAHDGKVLRDDGKGHPTINCCQCGKINVFGLEPSSRGMIDGDSVLQVLGRSESDIRYLEEKENGDQGDRDRRMVREEYPPEESLAGGSRPESEETPAGDGDRDQGA
jgi:hypothetical protein